MWRWASDISWSRLKWQYPVINEPKCCCFLFVFVLFLFFVFVFFVLFCFFCCCFFCFVFFFCFFFVLVFFFWGGGKLDYFLVQLLSELCFPTWLFTFSKVCFKFSDQTSMTYLIDTHMLPRWGCSSLFPYTAPLQRSETQRLSPCHVVQGHLWPCRNPSLRLSHTKP